MSDYKPITGELRKYAALLHDEGSAALARIKDMCDAIDAVHAQLERENAALKAELDRVTGEQEERTHARSESITGELRDWYKDRIFMANGWQEINDIADRIDVEHELEVAEAHTNGIYEGFAADKGPRDFIELPKDADGEYIHIGDVMDSKVDYLFDGKPFTVRGLMLCEYGWEAADGRFGNRYDIDSLRHHHAPTVEDVLQELVIDWDCAPDGEDKTDVLKEYAAKLQLKEDK